MKLLWKHKFVIFRPRTFQSEEYCALLPPPPHYKISPRFSEYWEVAFFCQLVPINCVPITQYSSGCYVLQKVTLSIMNHGPGICVVKTDMPCYNVKSKIIFGKTPLATNSFSLIHYNELLGFLIIANYLFNLLVVKLIILNFFVS